MTQVRFWESIPNLEASSSAILIYDEVLSGSEPFDRLAEAFEHRLGVTAGEQLKDVEGLPAHIADILRMVGGESRSDITIVAAGGGSVGDFAGFVASIIKRGVDLVHLPTTWLAAVDSAHGGKTALNVAGIKNQIGTFHAARDVLVVRPLLDLAPEASRREACAELVKMALIRGGDLWAGVAAEPSLDGEALWRLLPAAVEAKYAFVDQDPTETVGVRYHLNLGHTLGHALEAHLDIPHGVAVGRGLRFATNWSSRRGYLAEPGPIEDVLDRFPEWSVADSGMTPDALTALVDKDKKSSGPGSVNYVFLSKPGSTSVVEVTVDDLVDEARRQGWL